MDRREADIAEIFTAWLDRFSCPMHMRDRPEVAQAEAVALVKILCKFAPMMDYAPYLGRVFEAMEFQMKGRVWPTVNEIGAACSNVRKEAATSASAKWSTPAPKEPEEIAAARMKAGDAVGEGWLYGALAVEMIAKRMIDEDTMRAYRSAAFLSRKAIYGEGQALAWEAEAKRRHDTAKEVFRHRNDPSYARDMPIPDKSAPIPRDFHA